MLRLLIAIGVVLSIACHPALAGVRKEIWLQRGVPMTLEGVVSQSEHDRYLLLASLGQTLQIKLESTTNNGVFSVFGPGYTEESDTFVSGRSSHQEVTSARVVPATSGTHLIDVGSLGGTTRYRMIVTVEGYTSDSRETTSSQNASALAQKDTPLLLKDTYVPRLLTDTWLRCGEGRSGDVTRVFLSDGTFIQMEANGASNRSKISTVGDYAVSEQSSMQAKVTFPRDVLTSTEKSLEKKMWRYERITSSPFSAVKTFWHDGEQTKPFLACDYGDKLSPTELANIKSTIRSVTSRKHLAVSSASQKQPPVAGAQRADVGVGTKCTADSTASQSAIDKSIEFVTVRAQARRMNCLNADSLNDIYAGASAQFKDAQGRQDSPLRANIFWNACNQFQAGIGMLRSVCNIK